MKNTKDNVMYYSQFGEDKILSEIFNGKSNGLCIEVGANDGVNDSTTMYFEKIGWVCILVEPNPVLCKEIRATRSSILFECAASDKSGKVTLFVAEGAERAHGVSTINATEEALNQIKSYGFTYNEVQVQAKTLDEILGSLKLDSEIDFISVDVEGHELDVLRGFSIEQWSPKLILMEDNSAYENSTVSNYLKKFGYYRFMRTGVNDWYTHKSNRKLVNLNSRSKYFWGALKTRLKNQLRKIPGILKIRNFLSSCFTKST